MAGAARATQGKAATRTLKMLRIAISPLEGCMIVRRRGVHVRVHDYFKCLLKKTMISTHSCCNMVRATMCYSPYRFAGSLSLRRYGEKPCLTTTDDAIDISRYQTRFLSISKI